MGVGVAALDGDNENTVQLRRVKSVTHSHGLDGFDELLALQVLQDLVDLCQREVALEPDVSAPDPWKTMQRNATHKEEERKRKS